MRPGPRRKHNSFIGPVFIAERLEETRASMRDQVGRALPYPNGCFEVVLSHRVVHNLEKAEDRLTVVDEMLRVLRPGGVIGLADIDGFDQYRKHLQFRGVAQLPFQDGGLEPRVMGALSGGSFRPQALLAVRP